MKKKVSLFLTALCCAVGAVSASEVDSVQVAEVHGNVAARKQRTDNDEYTRFRVGETSMDDIEVRIAGDYLEKNRKFMED